MDTYDKNEIETGEASKIIFYDITFHIFVEE